MAEISMTGSFQAALSKLTANRGDQTYLYPLFINKPIYVEASLTTKVQIAFFSAIGFNFRRAESVGLNRNWCNLNG